MVEAPRSPVTQGETFVIDSFNTATVVQRYWQDWKIDVSSYFEGVASLPLYRCRDTGYRFFHPPSLAGESEFYDRIWSMENCGAHQAGMWRDDLEYALGEIRRGERVIDVGCADGTFVERVSSLAYAIGIDGNSAGCRIAAAQGRNVQCSTLAAFAAGNPGAFDTVVASQVLEHVYDVAEFIENLIRLARPGGRILISVPNNDPFYASRSKYEPLNNPPHHIGLWNEDSLRAMASYFGLRVIKVKYLSLPDRLALRVYRQAAYMVGVTNPPKQLTSLDWLRIVLAAPLAFGITTYEKIRKPTSFHAYMSVTLESAA